MSSANMPTRRVTRSATAALKELDKNAAVISVAATADAKPVPATTKTASAPKRKRAASTAAKPVKAAKKTKIIVKRGWTLPHGMGITLPTTDNAGTASGGDEAAQPDTSEALKPQTRGAAKSIKTVGTGSTEAPKREARGAAKKIKTVDTDNNESMTTDVVGESDKSKADFKMRIPRKTNKYGMTRGYSPYPYRTVPTKEQCEEVHRILVETHGAVTQPTAVPPPSITVAGCGEVPAVLDALCRTIISGNTLMANADKAVENLAKVYGVLKDGVGAGSIDWNAVWLAPKEKLVNTIKVGGTPNRKAGHIKNTLDMVHEEQKARACAHIAGVPVPGAQNEDDDQKALEVKKAFENHLSLEHVRAMTVDEALTELVRYPGIGVKTAACVALFTLRFPCFAVDTHVHKFCRWLGWVPEKATDVDTFNHGEHMVPDHLKYALHQLFIRHGQDCFKCRKNTKPGSDGWNEAPECPLEHLLDRSKDVAEEKGAVDAAEKQAAKGVNQS